jgi:hypothetical protein
MNIRILNSEKNEWYDFDVNNTTTMKTIREHTAQIMELEPHKLRTWISSPLNLKKKKEWPSEQDSLTLASCGILGANFPVCIIVSS